VRWLGHPPVDVLFTAGHLSTVVGVRLFDGRRVVIKARPLPSARVAVSARVQASLPGIGFPCPLPLAGPQPLGPLTATAETYLPGGAILPAGADLTVVSARALARLIALTPPADTAAGLDPPPPWAWPLHDQGDIWPVPDDCEADLNAHPGPPWLDVLGHRIRDRLNQCRPSLYPPVVGHIDWEAQNLRWTDDGHLHAVHDWDSLAIHPEPVTVGLAAAVHTATGQPFTEATTGQAQAFLTAYQQAGHQTFTPDETQQAWAAGLWVRAFNAKKATLNPHAPTEILDQLADHARERLRLAGI
jgi:Phosphotransferase enzyme family